MKNATKASTARATKSRPRAERRPRQWWLEHYQSWKASRVPAAQYCAEQGIHLSSFYNWACRFLDTIGHPLDTIGHPLT